MHPRFFGESRDIAKRHIMRWLAPNACWAAHPMWFGQRPEPPCDRAFLDQYAAALDVDIVEGESPNENEFLRSADTCREHLLLDPDTGLGDTNRSHHMTHVRFDQFIWIVESLSCQDKLTLVYDQGYSRSIDMWEPTRTKLSRLRESGVHSAAYMAEPKWKVCFIWASTNCEAITEATRRMQTESGFLSSSFLDDGCGHVNNDQ